MERWTFARRLELLKSEIISGVDIEFWLLEIRVFWIELSCRCNWRSLCFILLNHRNGIFDNLLSVLSTFCAKNLRFKIKVYVSCFDERLRRLLLLSYQLKAINVKIGMLNFWLKLRSLKLACWTSHLPSSWLKVKFDWCLYRSLNFNFWWPKSLFSFLVFLEKVPLIKMNSNLLLILQNKLISCIINLDLIFFGFLFVIFIKYIE